MTSVRRVGVMPKRAVGLPRVAVGREGTDCTLGYGGGALAGRGPRSRDDFSCEVELARTHNVLMPKTGRTRSVLAQDGLTSIA